MTRPITRRELLARGALGAAALAAPGCATPWLWEERPLPPGEAPRVACIGVGMQGWIDSQRIAAAGARVTALCDVDATPPKWVFLLRDVRRAFPDARFHRDYREMLAAHADDFDAVVISTPDHTHAHAALLAMQAGKHVFCQKPLTWSIDEARALARAARASGVVTQMGNQGHARDHLRRAVELVRGGAIGRVQEVHCFTNRPIWPQGLRERPPARPVPDDLDWDLWLGPAPERPYADGYHPFDWRGFWDFGTGALGDMGCHILDMPLFALDAGAPLAVEAECEDATDESPPTASTVRYRFAAGAQNDELDVVWTDGGRLPPEDVHRRLGISQRRLRAHDCVVFGSEGALLFDHLETLELRAGARTDALHDVPTTLPRVVNNAVEWIDAIRGGPPPLSRFELSGPFTETVLAGNLAIRAGRRVAWEETLAGPGRAADLAPWLARAPRAGWALPELAADRAPARAARA